MTNLLIAIAGILNLFLAGLTYLRNPNSQSNFSFALLSFSMGLWALFFIPYNNPFIFDSLFWIKIVYLMVTVMVFSMIYFSYSFPYNQKPNKLILSLFLILNLPIIYMLFFTEYFVIRVEVAKFGPETIVGPFYFYGALIWGVFGLGLGTFNLAKKYFRASGVAKFQLLYMFLGLFVFSMSAMILDGIIPIVLKTTAFFSLSAVFSLFFVGLTAYSIVRHRLLDIRIAIQEVAVFLTTTFIISSLFIGGAAVYWVINSEPFKFGAVLVIVMVSAVIALSYDKLSSFAKTIARKYLSLSVYDYQKALKDLSLNLAADLELQKLINTLSSALTQTFKLKKNAILLADTNNRYIVQQSIGFSEGDEMDKLYSPHILDYLNKTSKILAADEVRILSDEIKDGENKNNLKEITQIMDQIGISLIIPLQANNKIISLIMLGEKASLDPYTVQDINFLNTIAYEASVAFQNAKSYEEIKKFNITLRQEIYKATKELQFANSKLQELDKLKDDFVSVASHELRTPMTAIRSYAWMALHRSDIPLSQRLQRYLYRVLVSTERLINLVNDMLNLSRIEAGRIEILPKAFDIATLVKDIVEDVIPKALEKRLQITVLEHQTPQVFADPDKAREILLNLIGNSLKFVYPGGLITIDFFCDGKMVEVSVKDNGAGISPEDLAKLFHKFSRLENSYTSVSTSGGTGLGLYISKNLIELMKGKIWATSDGVDKGATFTFSLPVASPETLKHAADYKVAPKDGMEAKALEPVAL